MLFANNFYPVITKPTRLAKISYKRPTLIDHVYTNSLNANIKSSVCLFDISDHLPIFCHLPFQFNRVKKNVVFKRNFKHFDRYQFKLDFDNSLKQVTFNNLDVNAHFEALCNILKICLDKHAPYCKLSNRELKLEKKPWITKGIYKSIRQKQKCIILIL